MVADARGALVVVALVVVAVGQTTAVFWVFLGELDACELDAWMSVVCASPF